MNRVLDGLRVLDITRYVAGPVCAAQLADLGAEVIHLENVGGGEDRAPLPVDPGFPGGAGFIQVNRSKKSLTLDLTSEKGQDIFKALVKTADIVVLNVPPKAAVALGIDYASLAASKADIISAHITSFGHQGPYTHRTGFDAIAQVMGGSSALSGRPDDPMKSAMPMADMTTGNHAVIGILAALLHRQKTGEGQEIQINLWQSMLSLCNYFMIEEQLTHINRPRTGNRAPSGAPADLFHTQDGQIYVAVLGNPMFRRFAQLLGQPELGEDGRFQSDEARASHSELLSEITQQWCQQLSTEQALDQLAQSRIPAGPQLSLREILDNDHTAQAGYFEHVTLPGVATAVPYITPPYRLSKTPARIDGPPPLPGQHNREILAALGYSDDDIDALARDTII